MIGFLMGVVAGGVAVWLWHDRISRSVQDTTDQMRERAAHGLETAQRTAESAVDSVKEQIREGLQAGQEYLRSGERDRPIR
jgi:hypothetical protein